MTVQVSQINTPQVGLFQDSYTRNQTDNSFPHYLEEEQKRLAAMFSPFTQFNFYSWFEYPDFSIKTGSSTDKIDLFSDMELKSPETAASNTALSQPRTQSQSITNQSFYEIANNNLTKPTQTLLQNLLMKTGWLVPNLEASSYFHQAELEGKLLNKLDLQFLVDQIVSQVKLVKEKGKVELSLGLRPENLGEILLTLTSRSGMISIQIQALEETRKLIEAGLKELELALKKAKVNLAEIKITRLKEVGKHAA